VLEPTVPQRVTEFRAAEAAFTCSGTVVTVTTTRDHWMEDGDRVVVYGATPEGYNGDYIVKVTGDTTFTYNVNVPLGEESGGAFYVRKIIIDTTILGKKAPQVLNTGSVHLGVKSKDGTQAFECAAGGEYYLTPPEGQEWDLADWWLDVANAGDGLVIFYS